MAIATGVAGKPMTLGEMYVAMRDRLAQGKVAKQTMIAKALGKPLPPKCQYCATPGCNGTRHNQTVSNLSTSTYPMWAGTAISLMVNQMNQQLRQQTGAMVYSGQVMQSAYLQPGQVIVAPGYTTGTNISISNLATTANYTIGYDWADAPPQNNTYRPAKGNETTIRFDDGSYIEVAKSGSYRLFDKDAKVTYRANRSREFNRYINASDLLAEFITYLGTLKLQRSDVQTLPVGLFINWLIIRAAEADEDDIPADVVPVAKHKLLTARVMPRCLFCARFVPRKLASAGFAYCNPVHAGRHHQRLLAA